jgi:5-methylcytosine-specific restriction protein A
MRTVKEWVGRTDNAMPPPTVRLRIFEHAGGICHLCECKIQVGQKWHASHIKSIWDGGENRESNIAPAHVKCHQAHTAKEKTEQAEANQRAMKHLGIKTRKGPPMPGSRDSKWKRTLDGRTVLR